MSSGGYRPGSGRPRIDINDAVSTEYMPEPRSNSECERKSPLEYLVDLYNDVTIDAQRRDRVGNCGTSFPPSPYGQGYEGGGAARSPRRDT
jgi:hypothetical protein